MSDKRYVQSQIISGGVIKKQPRNLSKKSESKPKETSKRESEESSQVQVQFPKKKKWVRAKALDVPENSQPHVVSIFQHQGKEERKSKVVENAKKQIEKYNNPRSSKEEFLKVQNSKQQSYISKKERKWEQPSSIKERKNVSYPCSFCNKSFTLEDMQQHHSNCEMAFKCEQCLDYFPLLCVDDHYQCCKGAKKKAQIKKPQLKSLFPLPFKSERKRPMMEAFRAKEEIKDLQKMYNFNNENPDSQEEKQFERMQLRQLGLENLDLNDNDYSNPIHVERHDYEDDEYEDEGPFFINSLRQLRDNDEPKGLTEDEIDRLATDIFRKGESADDIDCGICTSNMEEDDMVIRLPCLHTYHADCLVPWLQMKSVCPTCKHNLK